MAKRYKADGLAEIALEKSIDEERMEISHKIATEPKFQAPEWFKAQPEASAWRYLGEKAAPDPAPAK